MAELGHPRNQNRPVAFFEGVGVQLLPDTVPAASAFSLLAGAVSLATRKCEVGHEKPRPELVFRTGKIGPTLGSASYEGVSARPIITEAAK